MVTSAESDKLLSVIPNKKQRENIKFLWEMNGFILSDDLNIQREYYFSKYMEIIDQEIKNNKNFISALRKFVKKSDSSLPETSADIFNKNK